MDDACLIKRNAHIDFTTILICYRALCRYVIAAFCLLEGLDENCKADFNETCWRVEARMKEELLKFLCRSASLFIFFAGGCTR